MEDQNICKHLLAIKEVQLSEDHVCEECVKEGTDWVHLRTCQTCGVTLCCDQSSQQHMTKHNRTTGHPVVASAEAGERWLWCYADQQFVEY
jgi:hypothetical protein